jgi:hypothetical protein
MASVGGLAARPAYAADAFLQEALDLAAQPAVEQLLGLIGDSAVET